MDKPGKNVPGLVFFYFLIALGLVVAVVVFSIALNAKRQIEAHDQGIKSRYIESEKILVRSEIERIAVRARELRARADEKARADLEERLSALDGVVRVRGIDRKLILSLEYAPRGVRFFVVSKTGTLVFSGVDEHGIGRQAASLETEFEGFGAFVGQLIAEGEAYRSLGSAADRLIVLGKYDEASGYYVCAAASENTIERDIQTQLLEALGEERFGENGYGYFFVFDENYVLLQHGVDKTLIGKNLKDIPAADGVDLRGIFSVALENAEGAFVKYQWIPSGRTKSEEKTTYLVRFEPWNWIIGSGFYLSDFDQNIRRDSIAAAKEVSKAMNAQFAAFALAVLASIIVGIYLVFRVGRVEKNDARHLAELTRYKLLLDESALVSRTDPSGTITYVNDRFCLATGYTREQAIGKSHNIERHPSTPKELFRGLWKTIKAGRTWHGIIKNKRADGSSYYKQATILPILDESGSLVEYIAAGQDITELVEQREKLERVFHTDQLTGLGSRIKLLEDIERTASPSVALVDVVDFGRINDAYGEARGDEVLKECALRLAREADRAGWTLYRIYADTFAFLSETPADGDSLVGVLKVIRESFIGTPFALGSDSLPLDLRIGVASGDKDVLAYADLALGAARARNVEIYRYGSGEDGLSADLTRSVAALKEIHAALRGNRVYPVFQPIADASSGRIGKYECLLRAETEDGRVMPPSEFLPVSKKTRLYPSLTRSVIEQSIRAFSLNDYEFSINLTLEDLFNASTLDLLLVSARDAELGRRIVVEIVETEELVGFEEAIAALKRLKAEGIRIAIDDFGTGYSNFNYLLQLEPDYVKIDGSIVSRIVDDPRAEGLARSIVAFAKDAGIKTVAEYVSTPEIAEAARALGIDLLQGYWIGKPVRKLDAVDASAGASGGESCPS